MMRKLVYGFCMMMLFFQFLGIEKSFAATHKLENLHIEVTLHEDGSARIVEKRWVDLSEGTENFIVIGNLGKSEIKDFVVKEDGETYEFIDDWDIDATRTEKIFRNGLIKKRGGYELVWGIGEYGKHEYHLEYTVTNFIKQLEDSQILFWRFVNDETNIPPEQVTVEIHSEKNFSADEEKIWAFGYPGEVVFSNGKVVARNDEPLTSKDYVTLLVRFNDGLFTTGDRLNKTFDEIQDEAFAGSDYGKEKRSFLEQPWLKVVGVGFLFIFYVFTRIFKPTSNPTSSRRPRKFKRKYREEYYRDYPYEGKFQDAYYVTYLMGASNFERLLTAFILKWVKEGKIRIEEDESGFIFKRKSSSIVFLSKDVERNSNEGKLFQMMLGAAGSDEILQEKEFSNWAKKNYRKLISWEKNVMDKSLRKLKEEGCIRTEEKGKFIFKRKVNELTDAGKVLEENVYKYINYLHDFSLLDEHEAVNVKIWDEIMIWAAVLGITEVVRKQLKDIYPNYEQETAYSDGTILMTSSFSRTVSESRTPPRSSGGGGSASSGGGGGSFGGGSGGGTR